MIIRTSQNQIDDYYQKSSLNQSSIKVILKDGVQAYLDQASYLAATEEQYYYEEKEHFLVGTAVDHYMTRGEQSYLDNYHFTNVPKPKPGPMSVIKYAFDNITANNGLGVFEKLPNLTDHKQEIWASCTANNYQNNWKKTIDKIDDDARVNTVLKDPNSQGYFQALIEANGKQILSDLQNQLINQIIGNFTTHPRIAPLLQDSADIDIIYQLPIYFIYKGVYCKVLIDKCRVHHGLKRIFPIDFKTHGDYLCKFNHAIRIRRYDIQGSFYSFGCESKEGKEIISKLTGRDCSDYTVAPFALIAESTKAPKTPMIFILTDDLLKLGRYGNGKSGADRILGWEEGIDKFLLWHDNNFDMDEVVKNVFGNGIVQVMENYEFHKTF